MQAAVLVDSVVSVQLAAGVNVPVPLVVNLTVPVGAVGVPVAVSVTVALQELAVPAAMLVGLQLMAVEVLRRTNTVTVVLPLLRVWEASPA